MGSHTAMIAGVLWAISGASGRDQLKISTNVVPVSLCRPWRIRREASSVQGRPVLAQQCDELVPRTGFDAIGADIGVVVPGHAGTSQMDWKIVI